MNTRKFLLVGFLLLLTISVFSQKRGFEYFDVIKVGNSKSVGGICTIKITDNPDSFIDYYVVVTPINSYSKLFIVDKSKTQFTVKSDDTGEQFEFDFIVYAKKEKPVPSLKKND